MSNLALAPVRSVLDLIGNTPMVELTRLETGNSRLFVKLENQNPGGSIKDRIGLAMIQAAELDGRLKPGGTIIEATAGNTGLGLALVAAQKTYRLILVIPDKMSQEKIWHLKALGTEILLTRSDVGKGHPDYYQDKAQRLAREIPGAFFVNQFENPANPRAHEATTGPEIWRQMNHDMDAMVCGVGSGGTITGLGRFFRRMAPNVEMILADPAGSILADYINKGELHEPTGSWLVEGIGEDFIPPVSDLSLVKRAYTVTDREAMETARTLLHEEGLLVGSSTGVLVAAALRYCRAHTTPKRVVTLVCDSGNKYLSKMYNDFWMEDQGLIDRPHTGTLADLIARKHSERAAIFVAPDDTLLTAHARMKLYDVSQLPVLERDRVVGLVDESDILLAVHGCSDCFKDTVRTHMTEKLDTVLPAQPIDALLPIFARDHVAIVRDGEKFLGLITRIDLLNYLRRKLT
ncbi:MAG: pyridoxal-phosphate dependent enzyme [Alphaproteobacteria bacterium]